VLAEVKTLYEDNLRDAPALLRRLADRIERGEKGAGPVVNVVLELDDGSVEVYEMGETSYVLAAIGRLQLGIAHLAAMRAGK